MLLKPNVLNIIRFTLYIASMAQRTAKNRNAESCINPSVRRLKRMNQPRPNSYADYRNHDSSHVLNSRNSSDHNNAQESWDKMTSIQRPSSFHSCIPELPESVSPQIPRRVGLNKGMNTKTGSSTHPKTSKCPSTIPAPIKLGNKGQVKTLAAIFNQSPQHLSSNSNSPTSPTNDFGLTKQWSNCDNQNAVLKAGSRIPIIVKQTPLSRQMMMNGYVNKMSPKGSETSSNLSFGRTYETLQFQRPHLEVRSCLMLILKFEKWYSISHMIHKLLKFESIKYD